MFIVFCSSIRALLLPCRNMSLSSVKASVDTTRNGKRELTRCSGLSRIYMLILQINLIRSLFPVTFSESSTFLTDGENLYGNVYKRTYYIVILMTSLHVCLLQTRFLKDQLVSLPLFSRPCISLVPSIVPGKIN